MAYNHISRQNLRDIAYTIQDYSETLETRAFTNLLLQLTQEAPAQIKIDIARGFLIFGIESNIEGLIKTLEELKIDPMSFEADQRLLDLCEFYDFLQEYSISEEIFNLSWNREELQQRTYQLIKQVVQSDSEIAKLESSVPNLETLKAYIDDVIQNYKKEEEKRWFINPDRHKTINFMQFVQANCQDSDLFDQYEEIEEKSETINSEAQDQIEMDIHLGLLLFVAMHIESKHALLPPGGGMLNTGSWFYKEVLSLLDVKESADLPFHHRIELLQQLLMFIYSVPMTKENETIISLENLKDFTREINGFIDTLRIQARTQPVFNQVSQVTANQTQYVTPYVGRWLMIAPVVNTLVSFGMWSACAPAARLVLLMYSNNASDQLYRALISRESSELSKTMVRLYSKIIRDFSHAIASGLTGFTRIILKAGSEGKKELYNYMMPEDKKLFERWVNKLLFELPKDIMPELEKKRIEYVLGLKPGQKLQLEHEDDLIEAAIPASPTLNFNNL